MTTHERASGRAARPGWRTVLLIAICTAAALVVGLLTRPAAGPLPSTAVGDQALADTARDVVGGDRPALAVACVTPKSTRTAVLGADPSQRFEIGSISKGLTGLLFADSIERGEVQRDQRLGSLLPVSGPLADVSLEQLATHRSGLPSIPLTGSRIGRNLWSSVTAGNPYGQSLAAELRSAERVELDAPPGTYSNLGFELLGAALSAAAERPYPDLLRERILTPVGMADTTVPTSPDQLTERDLRGETTGGRRAAPWMGEAMAPAGGVRSDIGDMAGLATALLTGTAPGRDALRPKADPDGDPIGWAWITQPNPTGGRTVVWHNGGTGGFTGFLGIDPTARTAVVLLSAVGESPSSITREGFTLLDRLEGCR